MKAAGMLFLSRGGARLTRDTQGVATVRLLCVDRIGPHQVEPWALTWTGAEAEAWFAQHLDRLTPGTPLRIEAKHLRAHSTGRTIEITAHLVSCALVEPVAKEPA